MTLCLWMIIVNIFKSIFKVCKSIWNYCTKSIYHFFEVLALGNHAAIVYRLWFMLSLKYAFGTETANGSPVYNLIGKACPLANYLQSMDLVLASAILLMIFRSIQMSEISLSANLPMSTAKHGISDLVNWLVIFLLLMMGAAVAAHVVFSPSLVEF